MSSSEQKGFAGYPTIAPAREESKEIKIFVYNYDAESVKATERKAVPECYKFLDSSKVSWINIDGLRKSDVEDLGNHFGIHP